MSELVALDWDYIDLDADTPELYLPGGLQKGYSDHETDDKNEGDERVYINAEDDTDDIRPLWRWRAWRATSSGIGLSSEGVAHSRITEAVNNTPPRTAVSILPLDVFSPT